ncbi:MAG: hypothetical protein NTU53_24055 [Planctomycetota bacterium]|nr:hypothetical protein [Planctomycetota bacterium]
MFGNALGWAISAIIVGATIWFLNILGEQGDISPPGPVGLNAVNWTAQLPIEPATLAPYMVDPIDPAPLYAEAITLYVADQYDLRRVERVTSTKSADAQRWTRIMELLLRAGKSSRPVVFGPTPADVINYDPEPKLDAVRAIGAMAVRLALLHSAEQDKDHARQYAEAVFSLGAKMYAERLSFGQYSAAHSLLGDSSLLLAKFAEDAGQAQRAATLQDFNSKRLATFNKEVDPVRRSVMVLEPDPGDMFALADRSAEPMWRVEAILALGRLRYSAERSGDKQGASKVVAALCTSGDPRIRTAAIAARDLTVEQFRKLR